MTHRERVLAVLRGEPTDSIPSLGECPMDVTCLQDILPEEGNDIVDNAIRMAEFFDNSAIVDGISPRAETISKAEDHHTYRYETGAVWHESYAPTFCREALAFPLNDPADLDHFVMPVPGDPAFYAALGERVQAWKQAGYFVQGITIGAWQAIYYYLTSFDTILTWMLAEPDAAARVFELTGHYSMQAAKGMLEAGVDAVFVASDLGSGQGLLFSPALFERYVYPWLTELADLCHRHGAYLHLHSHGHIQDIMDGIVASGVDILNPVGPSDHNDLALFKERWGAQITFMGGISTAIMNMTEDEIDAHVAEVMRVGCRGGRFIPRTESGIPPMPADKVLAYLRILRKYREQYGTG